MRNESHRTSIAILLEHVNAWRRAESWSRETVVQQIVEAHEAINGPAITGIEFEPNSSDTFKRFKANADRVMRWLDDATKDNNLLPANFQKSILAAMPLERRLHCLDDLYRDIGVGSRALSVHTGSDLDAVSILRNILAENADAHRAVAELVDGGTRDELLTAQRELSESLAATKAALLAVEASIARQGD